MSAEKHYTLKEAADLSGKSVDALRRRYREGKLPGAGADEGSADSRIYIPASALVAAGLVIAEQIADGEAEAVIARRRAERERDADHDELVTLRAEKAALLHENELLRDLLDRQTRQRQRPVTPPNGQLRLAPYMCRPARCEPRCAAHQVAGAVQTVARPRFLLAVGSGAHTVNEVAYNSPTCNNAPAVAGIGNASAEKIWYRALTTYMTSTTNYKGARTATLSAASDLFGADSTQYKAVDAAWTAVAVN